MSLQILKDRLDYHTVVRALGIPYIDNQREGCLYFRCLNPEHEDRDPSMKVQYRGRPTVQAGTWRCWNGSCRAQGWQGDIIDLVRVMRRCSLSEAVTWLEGVSGQIIGADILREIAERDLRQQHMPTVVPHAEMPFPQFLPEPHVPMPPDHPYFTETRNPPVDGSQVVEDGAVYVTGGPYYGYMVVPLRWIDGSIVTWQAIAVEPWTIPHRAAHYPGWPVKGKLYPSEAPIDQCLYGIERMPEGAIAVISEGIFDVWRARQAALPDMCPVGAMSNRFTHDHALGHDQMHLLLARKPREVVVLHDNEAPTKKQPEPPGLSLVLDVGAALGYRLPVSVASVPQGFDPDSAGTDRVRAALRARQPYGAWAVRRASHPQPTVHLGDL